MATQAGAGLSGGVLALCVPKRHPAGGLLVSHGPPTTAFALTEKAVTAPPITAKASMRERTGVFIRGFPFKIFPET